jgi:integrase
MHQGTWRRETLKLPPTPANLKYAAKLREEILWKIQLGQFSYAEYFPDSKNAQEVGESPTFGKLAEKWLGTIQVETSTRKDYVKRLNRYVLPTLKDRRIKDILYSDLAELLNGFKWGSMKTRNNTATVIRQVFNMAFLDGLIEFNPASRIRNAKVQKEPPDPFTLEEVNLLIDCMLKEDPEYANYFEFAFFTGLRTSELLAVRWEDIDWNLAVIRVCRAKVENEVKSTKTASVRDVELNSRALAALGRQKKISLLAGKEIFINPNTGEAIGKDNIVRAPWTRALRKSGIRYRNPYQTRHTFATLNLMAGANPMWVSRQMGHTTMKMLLEVYSRWIDSADRGRERGKIEALLGGNSPSAAQTKKSAT